MTEVDQCVEELGNNFDDISLVPSNSAHQCLEKINELIVNNVKEPCTSLKINAKLIDFAIPPTLLQLTSLKKLELTNNGLISLGEFNDFSVLKSLTKLDLSGNAFTGEFPVGLGGGLKSVTSLKKLYLSRNKITSVGAISNMKKLEKLDLSSNLIVRIDPEIKHLARLQKINLRDNQLDHIPELPSRSLKKLDMSDNIITHIPEFCGTLKNLHKMDVSRNCITTAPPSLAQLYAIGKLDLRYNPMIHIPDTIAFSKAPNLQLRHSVPNAVPGAPGLYIGALCSANNIRALNSLNITHILTVAGPTIDVERDHRTHLGQKSIKNIQLLARKNGSPEPTRSGQVFNLGDSVTFIMDGMWLPATVHFLHARNGQAYELKYRDPKTKQTMYRTIRKRDAPHEIRKLVEPKVTSCRKRQYTYCKLEVLDLPEVDIIQHFPAAFAFIDQGLSFTEREKTYATTSTSVSSSTSSSTSTSCTGHTSHIDLSENIINSKMNGNIRKMKKEKKTQSGGVLVHCRVGVSRSATMIIGYLVSRLGISVVEAIANLKKVRPIIKPNDGFREQLDRYEKWLLEQGKRKSHSSDRIQRKMPTV